MAGLQIQGAGGSVAEVGAFASKGLHSINKPHDYGALGHYRGVFTTGTIAAGMAANGELLQMRWVDSTRFCVITHVQLLQFRSITAFAAGTFDFNLTRATAWSADGSGGNAVTVTDPAFQLRAAAMGQSLFSTGFRLATTAALGAGTKTLDANNMGSCFGHSGSTPVANSQYVPNISNAVIGGSGLPIDLISPDTGSGEHPIVLTSNGGSTSEGIVVRANVPATGTWVASFLVKWMELTAF